MGSGTGAGAVEAAGAGAGARFRAAGATGEARITGAGVTGLATAAGPSSAKLPHSSIRGGAGDASWAMAWALSDKGSHTTARASR
jgi:hypothetical protein